jgi:DNA-binding NarL/FixJ family response regulator
MLKILIVEDSNIYRQLLKETLCHRFPQIGIAEAKDGKEALNQVEAFLPDIVFMDIKLPGESGLELTRRIKYQFPATKIIILTSYDLPEYREAAAQYQANFFLAKGTTTKDQIINLVESILSGQSVNMGGIKPNGWA